MQLFLVILLSFIIPPFAISVFVALDDAIESMF